MCAELTKFATAVDTSDKVEHIDMSITIVLLGMCIVSEVVIGDRHLPSDDVSGRWLRIVETVLPVWQVHTIAQWIVKVSKVMI